MSGFTPNYARGFVLPRSRRILRVLETRVYVVTRPFGHSRRARVGLHDAAGMAFCREEGYNIEASARISACTAAQG